MGAQQLRLDRHEVAVTGREMDQALEVEVVLDAERDGHRPHAHARHGRVADIDEVHPGGLEEPGGLDRPLDADRSRRVDLDRDHVTAFVQLREERRGRGTFADRVGRGRFGDRGSRAAAWAAVDAAAQAP